MNAIVTNSGAVNYGNEAGSLFVPSSTMNRPYLRLDAGGKCSDYAHPAWGARRQMFPPPGTSFSFMDCLRTAHAGPR